VPLGNVEALRGWADAEAPSDRLWRQIAEWVLNLSAKPWQEPSTPQLFVPGGVWEVRVAEIQEPDSFGFIDIFYEHRQAMDS
jgi:hypothetical protein